MKHVYTIYITYIIAAIVDQEYGRNIQGGYIYISFYNPCPMGYCYGHPRLDHYIPVRIFWVGTDFVYLMSFKLLF